MLVQQEIRNHLNVLFVMVVIILVSYSIWNVHNDAIFNWIKSLYNCRRIFKKELNLFLQS